MIGVALLLAACGGSAPTAAPAAGTGGTAAPAAEQPAAGGKTKIRFYANITEDASSPGMIAALQDHFKDKYEIEPIKVDFSGNLDTVIKTAIVSGDPADIYFYWPASMRSYADAGQALDLTPYLEANNGEWKKTFIPSLLELAKIDGKYYSVPTNQQSGAFFVNDTLAQQLGVSIPDQMTWEQFMSISEQIKAKGNGVFPFAIQAQWQAWVPRNGILSLGKDANKLEALAKGEVPATDPIFRTALENAGELYKKGYVYPGDGALTANNDEILAAFKQGKIMMVAAVFSFAQKLDQLAKEGNFTLKSVGWPLMGKQQATLGGTNGLFIPSNVKNKDAAVEVLKYYTGKDVQAINAKFGLLPSTADIKIDDAVLAPLLKLGESIYPYEFASLSPEVSTYVDKNLLPDYVLGSSADEVLGKLEQLRQQALAKKK
jgi:ABC-type glycerol-3-phosphate transport system substrate-binding protein